MFSCISCISCVISLVPFRVFTPTSHFTLLQVARCRVVDEPKLQNCLGTLYRSRAGSLSAFLCHQSWDNGAWEFEVLTLCGLHVVGFRELTNLVLKVLTVALSITCVALLGMVRSPSAQPAAAMWGCLVLLYAYIGMQMHSVFEHPLCLCSPLSIHVRSAGDCQSEEPQSSSHVPLHICTIG